ncbi:MAG: hypothetical protein J6U30_00350, partial [Oscillospiraceae bacterium]|nr:hypothetical protein [Oscillospiraceae bacterium]
MLRCRSCHHLDTDRNTVHLHAEILRRRNVRSRQGMTKRKRLLLICSLLLAVCAAAAVLLLCGKSRSGLQMYSFNRKLKTVETDDFCRTTYEIFPWSFCDSDGDGTGDLKGIISKLDYIRDLGFDQIWITPVHPSPSYHKYDVTDYYSIDPAFGTVEDYEKLL